MPTQIIDRTKNPLDECLSKVQTAHRYCSQGQGQGQRQERESSGRVSHQYRLPTEIIARARARDRTDNSLILWQSVSHQYRLPTEIIARARAGDRRENHMAECQSPVQTVHRDHSQGHGQRQERNPLAECLSPVQTAHRDHSQGQDHRQ